MLVFSKKISSHRKPSSAVQRTQLAFSVDTDSQGVRIKVHRLFSKVEEPCWWSLPVVHELLPGPGLPGRAHWEQWTCPLGGAMILPASGPPDAHPHGVAFPNSLEMGTFSVVVLEIIEKTLLVTDKRWMTSNVIADQGIYSELWNLFYKKK